MLTKLRIRNFKKFDDVEIELGSPVVFVGPNNSGKTTALQALALWDVGLRRWNEKRSGHGVVVPKQRVGVTINRRDLLAVPVPSANLLWRDLHVRGGRRTNGEQKTTNILIEIIVDGFDQASTWRCGFEFDYANSESFYCRPIRASGPDNNEAVSVTLSSGALQLAYLPPMSGLLSNETRIDSGAIKVRLGEGRTAEVLRNLCYQIFTGPDGEGRWDRLSRQVKELFGVALQPPEYVAERGEIQMQYSDTAKAVLDLSSSGRGLQQTLLLLAHLTANPGSILLLDEPDAHLEILRQRQIYQVLTQAAAESGSQIIAASHSEVILNEAAGRDSVVAFVGKPHRIDGRKSQLLEALSEIGFDQYYQAEQVGWVLYLEGSTDLAILRQFAETLGHPAAKRLARPFVHYVGNQPKAAEAHFFGLREAIPDLRSVAAFDRLDRVLPEQAYLPMRMWKRREIENYLCQREVLDLWLTHFLQDQRAELFASDWTDQWRATIDELEHALETLGRSSPWSADLKVTEDFLDPLFARFFEKIKLDNLMRKSEYHVLARFLPADAMDPEIIDFLDLIENVASGAVGDPSSGWDRTASD